MALVSCGATGAVASEPPIGSISTNVDPSTLTLPFDAYYLDDKQARLQAKAQDILAATCLMRYGLTWEVVDYADVPISPPHEREFGLADLGEARVRGYQPNLPDVKKLQPEPTRDPVAEMVMLGRGEKTVAGKPVPVGGCAAEASRILFEGVKVDAAAAVDAAPGQAYSAAEADSRVQAAFSQWSACMRGKGLRLRYADGRQQ